MFYIVVGIIVVTLLVFLLFISQIKPYPLAYQNEIKNSAVKYNIAPEIIASVIYAESGFNYKAKSNKGAVGLMQLLPSTAQWLANENGYVFNQEMLLEPAVNIDLGTCYLSYLFNKFDNLENVLASYNAGEGNVSLWLLNKKYSADGLTLNSTPFSQTNHYIEKVKNSVKFYEKCF